MEFDGPSEVTVDYQASVHRASCPAIQPSRMELIRYVRPSRYAESDRLLPDVLRRVRQAGRRPGRSTLSANWVNGRAPLRQWFLARDRRRGGDASPPPRCLPGLRPFAIALLRSKDVPARLAAVYAPGLSPMDFHAVAEAYIDDEPGTSSIPPGWRPRESMLRITAGRDSSDTAFLSTVGGSCR